MNKIWFSLVVMVVVGFCGCSSASNPQAEAAAVPAAEAWLSLVDGQQYGESWEEAAQFFKGAVKKDQWIQAMQSMRKPFGKNLDRELLSKQYHTALPGAPDGEYVVIQFKASFENKKTAVETITPMLDKDGQWRVSGYFME
jgi:Tfp pilus assembly protein PilF